MGAATARDPEQAGHRISWFAVLPGDFAAGRTRIPRNRHMNGRDWGWDATCTCGWDSRTGGAIQARVEDAIADHRDTVRWNASHPEAQI